MINCHRTIHDFIKAIAIKVCYIERVIALSGVSAIGIAILTAFVIIGIKTPTLGEVSIAIIPSLYHRMSINTTSQNDRRQTCIIETTNSNTERTSTFPIIISPRLTGLTINEIVSCQFTPCLTVNDRDKLWTGTVVMVTPSRTTGIEITPRSIVYLTVSISIANGRSVSKDSTFTSTYCHLGTTIAIEICNGESRTIT